VRPVFTTTLYKYLRAIEKTSHLATRRLAQTQRLLTGLHRTVRGLMVFVAALVVLSFVALSAVLSGPQYATANAHRTASGLDAVRKANPASAANIAPPSPANVAPASAGTELSLDIGTAGHRTGLSQNQREHAAAIIAQGERMGVPRRGLVIAVATAMQESKLLMYANSTVPGSLRLPHDAVGSDHDSVGLFQQRPGWGSTVERMDATESAHLFFHALDDVPGWQHMPLTVAAQEVQRSAFPRAYAKWEPLAEDLVIVLEPIVGPAEEPDPAPQHEHEVAAAVEPEQPAPAPEQDVQDEASEARRALLDRIFSLRKDAQDVAEKLADALRCSTC
jgi:hypothetical protein